MHGNGNGDGIGGSGARPLAGAAGCRAEGDPWWRDLPQGAQAALRRAALLERMLHDAREVDSPAHLIRVLLGRLTDALEAQGAAVLDALHDDPRRAARHRAGASREDALRTALILAREAAAAPQPGATLQANSREGLAVLASPAVTRFGERIAVALWRDGPAWAPEAVALTHAAGGVLRLVLEHEAIRREMMRRSRTDPLTLLLNRRAFQEEAARRIERLDQESLPGTLMLADLTGFRAYNAAAGTTAGDEALCLAAGLLRDTVRPADLTARLGGGRFGLWLDGADSLTAAERADALCRTAPARLAEAAPGGAAPGLAIGIASRAAESGEDLAALLHRARLALLDAKSTGRDTSTGAPRSGWRNARLPA